MKAAYNFVPLAESVFRPDWAKYVSHDVPFSDSVSGFIDFKITANTPIFVRNGSKIKQEIKEKESKFSRFNSNDGTENRYFIPGSSLKGAIRSVLEIMSFGHLDDTRVNDNHFYSRDFSTNSEYLLRMRGTRCGWLVEKKDGSGEIIDCGTPRQIRYDKLEEMEVYINRQDSIFHKYETVGNTFVYENFLKDGKSIKFVKRDKDGKNGVIVFTGAMSSKASEFVFFNQQTPTVRRISKNQVADYEASLSNYKKAVANEYEKSEEGEKAAFVRAASLPKNKGRQVFFTLTKDDIISTIGFVYSHKFESRGSVYQGIPSALKVKEPDLADLIFGSAEHKLRGRVIFGHAETETAIEINDEIKKILSSPKPSFALTYLQNKASWDYTNLRIAGRKRYPIKPIADMSAMTTTGDTITNFFPLDSGSTFNCKVKFHNLKAVELGALISAITFHGQQAKCKHSIGMAKAFGFGNVSVSDVTLDIKYNNTEYKDINYFLELYKIRMNMFKRDWLTSPELNELFLMAQGVSEDKISSFESMSIIVGENNNKNDFQKAKKERVPLARFSKIIAGGTESPLANGTYEGLPEWRLQENMVVGGLYTNENRIIIYHPSRVKQRNEGYNDYNEKMNNNNNKKYFILSSDSAKLPEPGSRMTMKVMALGTNTITLKILEDVCL